MASMAIDTNVRRHPFGLKPLQWLMLGLIALALGFGGWSLRGSLARSVSIAEAKQASVTVQLFGYLHSPGAYDGQNNWTFEIQDSTGATMQIVSPVKPGNFDEAISVAATGRYNHERGLFEADRLLVKCPSKYQEQQP